MIEQGREYSKKMKEFRYVLLIFTIGAIIFLIGSGILILIK